MSFFTVNVFQGFGANEIPMDLVIVGKGFWLERREYDGMEWWEFKSMPEEPEETRELELVSTKYWLTQ